MKRPVRQEPAWTDIDLSKGLFRANLAGQGRTLGDAFANLERAHGVERLTRHVGRNLFGCRVRLNSDEGQGHWDFLRIRGDIYVVAGDFAYKDPRVELLSGDGLVQFYFKLSGDLTMAITRAEALRLNKPSLLIYHQPLGTEVSEWTAPSSHERFVCINVLPQALIDIFASESGALPPQLEALIQRGSGKEIHYFQVTLSAEMFDLARKVVDSPHAGALGLVYTEALVMQLLCAAVGGIESVSGAPSEQYTQREMRCLQSARAMLMSQLSRPPTIRQVARAAGINETTLKHGFKAIFGETIFEFSVRCRMQHALTLLREQRMSVSEVGEAVGYRHQTSFATAFRRHFGMRPKDVRRGRKL